MFFFLHKLFVIVKKLVDYHNNGKVVHDDLCWLNHGNCGMVPIDSRTSDFLLRVSTVKRSQLCDSVHILSKPRSEVSI